MTTCYSDEDRVNDSPTEESGGRGKDPRDRCGDKSDEIGAAGGAGDIKYPVVRVNHSVGRRVSTYSTMSNLCQTMKNAIQRGCC